MATLNFPDAPTNGQVFDKWTWDAASGMWGLTGGGVGPRLIQHNKMTVDQTGITLALTVFTGYSITYNVVAGRSYQVTYVVSIKQAGASQTFSYWLYDNGAVHLQCFAQAIVTSTQPFTHFGTVIMSGQTPGPHTVDLRGVTVNTGNITIANSMNPGFFSVIDVT